jgi:hypothetical protein
MFISRSAAAPEIELKVDEGDEEDDGSAEGSADEE